jgi:hypothetical protein
MNNICNKRVSRGKAKKAKLGKHVESKANNEFVL